MGCLTTEGGKGWIIDCKLYGAEKNNGAEYSPAKCLGIEKKKINGNPDKKHESQAMPKGKTLL